MAVAVFLAASLALLSAFVALISWEQSRGARLFAASRARFDARIAHIAQVAEHTDWAAHLAEHGRALALAAGHDLAHVTLQLVRALERALARVLRQLRTRVAREMPASQAPARPFIEALSDFKEELKTSRPEDLGNPPE